jgi:cysteine desulfurase family protein (TIGR01976 family)
MSLDLAAIRAQFPALARRVGDRPAVFFDGPAGSQVPESVIDAVAEVYRHCNANSHGHFATSRESDARIEAARAAAAAFLGVARPEEIAFGANMTTLTLSLSRSLGATWKRGDQVIVTRLDHDANVTPWVLAARDAGAEIVHVGFRREDATLDVDEIAAAIGERTRLVAIGAASNATGTINPVAEIAALAHRAGAEVFVDAVHHAPHRLPDVAAWGADYMACSAYKFFGPHVGILWGRAPRFAELPAYQVRAAGDELPGRWSTGTSNLEGIAGTAAAIEYLAGLAGESDGDLRSRLAASYALIGEHEEAMTRRLLAGLAAIDGVTVWGIRDLDRLGERVATVSITCASMSATELARHLGDAGIFVWDGHFYALDAVDHLGLAPGGMVRIGLLHYNTAAEVDRLLEELARIAK